MDADPKDPAVKRRKRFGGIWWNRIPEPEPDALADQADIDSLRPVELYDIHDGQGGPRMPPELRRLVEGLNASGLVVCTMRKLAWWLIAAVGRGGVVKVQDGRVILSVKSTGPHGRQQKSVWPIASIRPAAFEPRVCGQCGCTDELGCHGGCRWVTDDLCSGCA